MCKNNNNNKAFIEISQIAPAEQSASAVFLFAPYVSNCDDEFHSELREMILSKQMNGTEVDHVAEITWEVSIDV